MSLNTLTPSPRHYGSGTPVMGRNIYCFPNCYHDPWWISQWKFLDISSGSGVDSKGSGPCSNTLKSSGTLTQVAGYRQASGVQFDGTSSCFYLNWNHGSGLGPGFSLPPVRGVAATSLFSHWGFMCSMKISDFSHDQFIVSKWNDVGSDREWYVGINTSGGVFYAGKQNGTTNIFYVNSPSGNWIPSGEWFDFAFLVGTHNNSAPDGYSIHCFINDQLWSDCIGTSTFDKTGASGVFVIGAANYGKVPSGFFTGAMEDFRWFNGEHPSMENYNAFRSGIAPMTSYPSINDINPYIGAHFQLNSWQSGNGHGITGQRDTAYIIERKNNMHLAASGTSANVAKMFQSPGDHMLRPGAADATYGSGTRGFETVTYFYRPWQQTTQSTLFPKGSFTVFGWCRPEAGDTQQQTLFGNNAFQNVNPVQLTLNARSNMQFYLARDAGSIIGNWTAAQACMVSGMWSHFALVYDNEQGSIDYYVSGVARATTKVQTRSGLWNWNPNAANQNFQFGWGSINITLQGFSGVLDEFIFLNYAVPSGQITSFYQQQSGFLPLTWPASGSVGGYTTGSDTVITYTSGMLGGYIITGPGASGSIGGWVSGIPFNVSGMLGGYVVVGPSASGNIGGYVWGLQPEQKYIGGYIYSSMNASGYIGGYTRAVENVDQSNAFVAFFNIIGRNRKEFDAQVKVYLSQVREFDAKAVVYVEELPPLVNIFIPSTHQSGNFAPYSYHFEATASGQQGKSIYKTLWFFTDITATSGSQITSSGTYATDHTFTKSGIFDVVFVAIDSNGLISSDRRIINTASGYNLPQITLNATPQSGVAPLSVAFSGVVNSAPSEIVEKYIYFGDGTRSACTDSIYKLYPAIGEFIPVFRVRDKNGFIVTDSTVIGVNN